MQAGFAHVDITPPIGTQKIGWLRPITPTRVADPLWARAAVFARGERRIALLALDTLSIRWTTVQAIRAAVAARCGLPGDCLMVAATHNHGGPAVANTGDVPRDERYLATLVERCTGAVVAAAGALEDAQIGLGRAVEFDFAYNRRIVMRQGVTRTHGRFGDPDALCFEGPIDPEVAVIAARRRDGSLLGAVVNFACHPVHHGGDDAFSGGWPAELVRELGRRGWPHALFVNGAAADIAASDPRTGAGNPEMPELARRLADAVDRAVAGASWHDDLELAAATTRVDLPYRTVTDEEVKGTVHGAQRFVDPAIYDRGMPALLERIRTREVQPAEVQALRLGDRVLVSIPAEYFCCLGLRIKERTSPRRTMVVGYANGMIGYVPHAEAFDRGGYETTFAFSSRMAREAGDLLADAAVELVKRV